MWSRRCLKLRCGGTQTVLMEDRSAEGFTRSAMKSEAVTKHQKVRIEMRGYGFGS